jgi:glutamate synthase domain-containing protein 2/glutamate synthase domain-containing protein 1/glutamate synthase domain-containing protein 3
MLPNEPMQGLYDPRNEHDGCGVALVARLDGVPSHEAVRRGLCALANMEHRGAEGADADTGDGAGMLVQIPDRFFRAACDFPLPEAGRYAVAVCFLPPDARRRQTLEWLLVEKITDVGLDILAWRDVPVHPEAAGQVARQTAPVIRQLFIAAPDDMDSAAFERALFKARRRAELASNEELIVPTCSSRTIVYKGMLSAPQLPHFYPDLVDERFETALALVHSRFSTNTFPSWELAHPYRMLAHNGEVNTLEGNRNWMYARHSQLESELLGGDIGDLLPIVRPGGSDSATLDNVVELLVMAGRSLPHALMMLIPEAFGGRDDLSDEVKGFFQYHSCLMEPWDGPASVSFTDGKVIGATLDRNGLRPGRWMVTTDGWVILASETGTFPVEPEVVQAKGRLRPGRLFIVDLERGRVFADGEIEAEIAARRPYGTWFADHVVALPDLPRVPSRPRRLDPLRVRQLAFGWTAEDVRVIVTPLATKAKEADGSMGSDVPLAVLSDRSPSLFSYFKQRFAQVTNPAIDPIRESIVMSLQASVGPELNLLEESPHHAHQLVMPQPVLQNDELHKLRNVDHYVFDTETLDCTWPISEGPEGLGKAVERLCAEAAAAVGLGVTVLILSDRATSHERVPVPSLLAVSAVHHHLVRRGTRLRTGIVMESGEPREVHHVACLLGYGASAVNPYLLFDSLPAMIESGELPGMTVDEAAANVVAGIGKGLLKVLSKMGISTIQSYTGAQIFEAVGLDPVLVDKHFSGTASRIGGVGLDVLAREALERHGRAYPAGSGAVLPPGGVYAWRRSGEVHQWSPEVVAQLQRAVRLHPGHHINGDDGNVGTVNEGNLFKDFGDDVRAAYAEFARLANEDNGRRATLRGLLRFKEAPEPIPLEEVEPASEIVKRFATGAMSLGSISPESHETLAIAMNRIGGRSNSGEGGEDPRRLITDENGDQRRSAIRQVASARFGVTASYLANADQLQIKVAQGAKPGEGGQLPGHKVSDYIAELRYSTPGVELISPPPHHDIYSIEDLKQLIYDLRCANPRASVSVKLVAEVGVGTVAAGVAKAGADHVVIAGHEGGTGSSPLSSIQSAGLPWELGLAETQQTLVRNNLRSRIAVQVDGQMKTGRDVVIAAMLGAEEMGFSTAPLVATGCIMMRVCHLNTCPVGIATQDPELRRRFEGTPEHVVNYFFLVAEEAREIMARLGIRRIDDLIGRADLMEFDTVINHWKSAGVDLSAVLEPASTDPDHIRHKVEDPPPVLDDALDHEIIAAARPALDRGEPVRLEFAVKNRNRTVGGLLSSAIATAFGEGGLPEGTITVTFSGSGGQSFGAWLAKGVDFTLFGDANDYAGKGLSGGVLAVRPPEGSLFVAEDNVIVGNTVLYGATSGRAFFRGLAGERFAVRNSGALAVVEGVGDHGCEYMTGGRVVVLGETGRNFAAGMSGGIAYVLDEEGIFAGRCNPDLVDLDTPGDEDLAFVRESVAEHGLRTGSAVAERLLARWDEQPPTFVKVMPRDYKKALERLAQVEAAV